MSYGEFVKRTLTVFGIGIFFVGFWYLRNIFMIAFLASIIAISLSIPVTRLQEFGMKRGYAIASTLFSALLIVILFMTWILPVMVTQMSDLVEGLPDAFTNATETYNEWQGKQNDTFQRFFPEFDTKEIERTLGLSDDQPASEALFSVEDVSSFALPVLRGAGNVIAGLVANLLIIMIVSIFLLADPMDYARGFLSVIPLPYQPRAVEIMVQLRKTVVTWMTAQSLSITVTIALVWIILGWILGVPNALALGVIAGIMTFIPNIGSIVPLIPITIFTLADEPRKLPLVLAAYLLIQQLESNFITPSFVKRQLSIPAGALLIFQLISGALFGVLGIVLAVPLLAVIITLIREIYVYDVLGMRGVEVSIEQSPDGKLKLITISNEDDEGH